jgi:hypothetical protein
MYRSHMQAIRDQALLGLPEQDLKSLRVLLARWLGPFDWKEERDTRACGLIDQHAQLIAREDIPLM